jgi:hypothetical protein
MADWIINPGTSIQTTINGAAPTDRILLNPGTYSVDNTLAISKTLTIMANVPGSYPNIRLNFSTYAYGLTFGANDIILDGLDIDNTRAGTSLGYIRASTAISNLTVQNCKIHNFRRWFVGDAGLVNGFNLLNSQVYLMYYTFLEISNAQNIQIKYNWFNQQTNTSGGEAAVTYYVPATVGTCEISYNYITGTRYGIELSPTTADSPSSGTILVCHNTVDSNMLTTHATNINSPYYGRYGTSFWTASGPNRLNTDNVTFRDNIFSRPLVYGMYLTGNGGFIGPFLIKNCLFFDNYWYYWPLTGRYKYEFYEYLNGRQKLGVPGFQTAFNRIDKCKPTPRSQRPIAGTGSLADWCCTAYENCIVMDPFFKLTGTTPQEFYALTDNSPAIGAASDGTNIGAWQ